MSDTPARRLEAALDQVATELDLPSLVLADDSGLLMAAGRGAREADEVAALAALRAADVAGRDEVASGRVKGRAVSVGDGHVVLGALGDTAITSAAFDRVSRTVSETLAR